MPARWATLAHYYAKNGDSKKGLDFIHRARGIDANDYELMYKEAAIDAMAGKQADALASLAPRSRKAIRWRKPRTIRN